MRFYLSLVLVLAFTTLTGCSTSNVATMVDPTADPAPRVMKLEYRDFEQAAAQSVSEMLTSGVVDHPKGDRYVMVISRIINDTTQNIDTDQLIKKIRIALLRSGKVVTTTAIGLNGAEDPMVAKTRKLRESQEVKQSTVAGKGQIIAPDLSLSGKIIQRNHDIDSKTQQVEYYFMLSLTDINSGLALWEGETPIIKRGSSKAVTW